MNGARQGVPDLRAFLDRLRRDSDLVEIAAPVDANLEAAEIHRRVIAAGGPALLFTNVAGADFPLVTNLFGTARRAELAFGERPLRLIKRLVHLAETLLPPTPAKLWGARDSAASCCGSASAQQPRARCSMSSTSRRPARSAADHHVLAGGRRALHHAAARLHDASGRPGSQPRRCIACTCTTRSRPACTGRSARAAASTTRSPRRAAQALPVTVFLGGPPALILSAIAPLPENVPELMLASLIAGERLPQVAAPNGHPHPLDRIGRVRADGRGAAARPPARRALRRSLRLLLAAARLSRVPGRARSRTGATRSIPRPSSASRGRRTSSSATCCRSCCRRSSRW